MSSKLISYTCQGSLLDRRQTVWRRVFILPFPEPLSLSGMLHFLSKFPGGIDHVVQNNMAAVYVNCCVNREETKGCQPVDALYWSREILKQHRHFLIFDPTWSAALERKELVERKSVFGGHWSQQNTQSLHKCLTATPVQTLIQSWVQKNNAEGFHNL